jgi:hypothetical protein
MNGFFKKILLFFLVFQILCGIIAAQTVPETLPPLASKEVPIDMLIDFGSITDILISIFSTFLGEYYGLLIGIFVAYLCMGYIQGLAEGYNDRIRARKYEAQREKRIFERVIDKARVRELDRRMREFEREREAVKRYARAYSEQKVDDIIRDMNHDYSGETDVEYGLGEKYEGPIPRYDEVYGWHFEVSDISFRGREPFEYSGKFASATYEDGKGEEHEEIYYYGGRGTTYWKADGSEESGDLGSDVTFSHKDESIMDKYDRNEIDKRNRQERGRFYRGVGNEYAVDVEFNSKSGY